MNLGANGFHCDPSAHPIDPEHVEICLDFLSRCEPTKTGRVHSYGLKHTIERWAGHYVTNGACIQAALDLGLTVEPIDWWRNPNARIGISRRSLRKVTGGAHA